MIACRRLAGMLALSLILTLACLTNASAIPVTWMLSGMTFDDGGTASGYFVYDADTDTLSASSISVAGGNTGAFPPTTYQGPGSPLSGDSTNGFYFWAPGEVGLRYMNIKHTGLTDAGGTVALALGMQSWECTNCGTIRYVSAGNVIGTPTPYFTSANAATFIVGTPGSFAVTTTAATGVTATGSLPTGVTFTNNGDGTATIAGTPAAGSGGIYSLTLTAGNGAPPDATQGFTLNVDAAPVITSANAATFSVGSAATFTVTTTGIPVAALNEVGALPTGVTFTDNGDGTATLAGTPAAGSGGSYALTIAASNSVAPDATQSFTLGVDEAPAITSANATTFSIGGFNTFTVATTGFPAAALIEVGSLPTGVTFVNNGDGTATLAGTPATGATGNYALTLTASNGVAPAATQNFTLSVSAAPAITSADATTFNVGAVSTFTVTTIGFPTAALTEVGSLPTGVTFVNNGDGTATLAGTPAAGSGGSYALTLTASNGVSPDAAQAFTLTVDQPLAPTITSAGSATFTAGTAGTFTITTTGFPVASLTETGALPAGVTFTDNGNGTATLSGTATSPGTSVLTITASNAVAPVATQTFTLTIAAVAIAAPVPAPVLGLQGLFALLLLLLTAAFVALRKPRQTR